MYTLRFFLIFLPPVVFLANGSPTVQKNDLNLPQSAYEHRETVKRMFVASYEAYRKYAFGHDDLRPNSKTFHDGRNGWGATIVDAMPTMYIMGLEDIFEEAVNHTAHIDFSNSHTNRSVSVFETTIRYLGGLLSAYEISNGTHLVLLQKAQELADKLAFAWVGSNPLPFSFLHFSNNTPIIDTSNIAEAGSLTMEWYTLSKYTLNDTYQTLAERAVRHIAELPSLFPGLPSQEIDPSTGEAVGAYVTWSGACDSYYEYLIKYPRLTNTNDPFLVDAWATAVDSTIKHLLKRSSVGNHTYIGIYNGETGHFADVGSHLACFHGGNWLYGGKLLNNQTIMNYALELIDSCFSTYTATATGIGPEVFSYEITRGNYTGKNDPTPSDLAFYHQHGFYIVYPSYHLRPEVLESVFYAWRITGDVKYLDNAVRALESFTTYLRTEPEPGLSSGLGFAPIKDVNNVTSEKMDDVESWWYAEVLKYLYLVFDDPSHISLDEYLLTTEGHPLKAPCSKKFYGSGSMIPHKQLKSTYHGKPLCQNPFLLGQSIELH